MNNNLSGKSFLADLGAFRSELFFESNDHIHLQAGASFTTEFSDDVEVAAFLPLHPAILNDERFDAGDFIEFDRKAGVIELKNENNEACDLILFGGERYKEPIVAEGPFIMNSKLEIANAYREFYNGRYGKIDYERQRAKASDSKA